MILVIEIAFLIAGLYALFTAKMPSWIVGKGFKAEGNQVRLIGGLMAALLPGVLCMGFTLGVVGGVGGYDVTGWVTGIEIIGVILVAIIVTVMIRNIRQPEVPPAPTNANIEPK
jgi:predicted lipid-binding transport protein (Tim44 family)